MLTLGAFVLMIAVLVTFHEYGHYWVARRCGVRVLKFSIGFGKPLVQWQRGGTTWQIALIPLGGFVQMQGESPEDGGGGLHDPASSFSSKHPLQKMAIVLAGPLANLLLAWLLFAGVFMHGQTALRPFVGAVEAGSVAEQSDLRAGDRLMAVASTPVASWEMAQMQLLAHVGEARVPVQVQRASGGEANLLLNLAGLGDAAYDARLLRNLGIEILPWTGLLGHVSKDGPANRAGLQEGDRILSIDGQPLAGWQAFHELIQQSAGKSLTISYSRRGETLTTQLQPERVQQGGKQFGRIGLGPRTDPVLYQKLTFVDRNGPLEAVQRSAAYTWQMSVLSIRMIGQLLTGEASLKQVSGPIGVAEYAGQSASIGLLAYIQFIAFISLSLAILNLLPVPVLDGGHFLYHTAELLRGRPLPLWCMEWGQRLGVALLLSLMALAFYNDINRLITG
ncbi:RIP metalloprotease RseP [Chitinilyticum aquatile]|uniref:RIP metalloprotease RseP n=1 Tax=Chitinilyticum aquatile TaxID=362520 RepID=UPI0004027790|nr:RIP metalloprotease RseP [Chitinilyticum aquatile]